MMDTPPVTMTPGEELITTPTVDFQGPRELDANCEKTYTAAHEGLLERHRVYDAQRASELYAAGHYTECQETCYEILIAQPSEAIAARMHTLLARKEVLPLSQGGRFWHAKKATIAWKAVIDRSGTSRFPIKEAKEGLEVAERLLVAAIDEHDDWVEVKVEATEEDEEEHQGCLVAAS